MAIETETSLSPPVIFLLTVPRRCYFVALCCYLCLSLPTGVFVSRSLVVTCWESADLLALLYVKFSCAFVTFPYDDLGPVWYLKGP